MLDVLDHTGTRTIAEPILSDRVPCEMADPIRYAPDGQSVESFRPCAAAADWRLALRWHHLVDLLDEHFLCERHLEIWMMFRIVESPPWDIALLERVYRHRTVRDDAALVGDDIRSVPIGQFLMATASIFR